MIEKQKQKISFLASISQEEWFLNGHCVKNGEEYKLMYLFESLIRQIKGGKFLELGCGTGLLSKYIYLFFKDVIPYGVDINRKFIARAKENNFKIKNNFTISDFFILPPAFFKKYSTIAVFMGRRKNEKDDWIKLGKLVKKCLRDNKEALLIICDYDNNTLEIKSPVIKKFVSEMKKISNIDFVDNNFFLVGEGVKAMNKIECEKTGFSNELIEGSIVQKGKEFFFLRQKRRNKKEKFFLTFQTNFFEKTLKLPSCSIDSVRIIGWEEIKAGDYVLINFGTKKNNVITVAKLVTK